MVAQDFHADGMEGAKPCHAFDHAANEVADTLLHFARGLVGEGDGQHLVGIGFACRQNMGKAGCEDAGFTSSGTGENQQWSLG